MWINYGTALNYNFKGQDHFGQVDRWEDTIIKMDFKVMVYESEAWIYLAWAGDRWRAFVNAVFNLWVS